MPTPTHAAVSDPARSHGAWIFLVSAVAAGSLLGGGAGVLPGLLVGTAFAGGFLALSAVRAGLFRRRRRFAGGLTLAFLAMAGALLLDAGRDAAVLVLVAAASGLFAIALGRRMGDLRAPGLILGLAAIALAAPASAAAGKLQPARCLALFALVWGWSSWRSLAVRSDLPSDAPWDRSALARRGRAEALRTGLWTAGVVLLLRVV